MVDEKVVKVLKVLSDRIAMIDYEYCKQFLEDSIKSPQEVKNDAWKPLEKILNEEELRERNLNNI